MTQRITREARVQLAGMLLIAAGAAWGLVSVALGEFNTTIGALSVIFALTWAGACAWYARRG
jgi:hypothetical protein